MRTPEELAAVRATVAARRQAHERAVRELDALPEQGQMVVWRCTQRHRRGQPKVAQAWRVDARSVLIASRIEWLPSDQLTLRPWEREHLLGRGFTDTAMERTDDRMLASYLDRLDEWAAGLPVTGPRWLRGMNPRTVLTVVEADREPVITPWLRCKDHPDQAEALRRADIFAAFR